MKSIFVIGTGRSGSTIMKRALGQNRSICTLGHEAQLWADPTVKRGLWTLLASELKWPTEEAIANLRAYLLERYKFDRKRHGELNTFHLSWISREEYVDAVDRLLSDYARASAEPNTLVKNFLEEIYRPLLTSEKASHIVDDAPINGLLIPEIQRAIPDAKFIHIIRSGQGVAASMLRLGWESAFETAAQRWARTISITRNLGQQYGGENYMEVRLSTLAEKPKDTFADIHGFLDISFEPSCATLIKAERSSPKYQENVNESQKQYIETLYRLEPE